MATTKAYEIGQLAGQLDVDSTGDITLTGNLDVSYSGFDSDFAAKTTTNLTEGDNLYYTTARADSDATVAAIAAISVTDAGGDGSLTYSNGAITYTGPSAAETRAHFSAGTGISINSGQISVNSSDNVTFADITTTGVINGPSTMYIDPAPVDSAGGLLVIRGDLQVDGTTTTVNSTTVTINDKNIVLADSAANASEADGAGITVEGANATITYDATNDEWDFNKDINVSGQTKSTSLIVNGSTANRGLSITTATDDVTDNEVIFNAPSAGSGELIFQTVSQERVRIDRSGNVGIGTDSPNVPLHISKSDDARLRLTDTGDSSTFMIRSDGVNTSIGTDTAHPVRVMTDNTERMRISSTGNVGIGTNSPADKLEIDIAASNTGITLTDNGDGFFPQISYDANRSGAGQSLGKFSGYWNGTEVSRLEFISGSDTTNKDDGELALYTRSSGSSLTSKIKITSAGLALIGTTSTTPGFSSTVTGIALNPTSESMISADGAAALILNRINSDGDILQFRRDGSLSGKIYSQNSNDIVIESTDDLFLNAGGATGVALYHSGGVIENLRLYTNNTERLRVLTGGNVGIGTTDPQAGLEVGTSSSGSTKTAIINQEGGNEVGLKVKARTNRASLQVQDNDTSAWVAAEDSYAIYGQHNTLATADVTVDTSGNMNLQNGSYYVDQSRHSVSPSLNLDFANSKELDSRITFYRNSIATYYDNKGVLRQANYNEPRFDHDPSTGESKGLLVEGERTNTTPYSEHIIPGFGWGISGSGTYMQANAGISPDGKYNATRIVFAGASHAVSINNASAWTAGDTVTTSMWIKGTSGETMRFASGGTDFGNVTLTGEWQRVEGTTTTVNTYTNINTYGGATARDILVWGAQAEVASFATSYIPSNTTFTSRSSDATFFDQDGTLQQATRDEPRYGYKYDGRKWVETGLILEPETTQLFNNTDMFGYASYHVSVDKEKSEDYFSCGTPFVKWIPKTSTTNSKIVDKYESLSSTGYHCFSIFAKAAGYKYVNLHMTFANPGVSVTFDLEAGTVYGTPSVHHGIEDYGNGIYRIWAVGNITQTSGLIQRVTIYNDSISNSYFGDGTSGVELFGPQLEEGFSPSTLVLNDNTATTATRSADVASSVSQTRAQDKTYIDHIDKYDWFNQDQGTIYTDVTPLDHDPPTSTYFVFNLTDKTTQNTATLRYGDIISGTDLFMKSFDTVEVDLGSFTSAANTQMKAAVVYEEDNAGFSVNGGTAKVDTSYNPTHFTYLALSGSETGYGAASQHIKKVSYYPVRLTNAEIQALTENN